MGEEYYISSFISGLKPNIKGAVKMFRPQKLADAIILAKQEEARTQMVQTGTKVVIHQKGAMSNSDSSKDVSKHLHTDKGVSQSLMVKRNNRTILSSKEINDRRMKGLCFNCDESYSPGHRCRAKIYMLLGEGDYSDEDADGVTDVEPDERGSENEEGERAAEISLNALSGSSTTSTIKLRGTHKKTQLNILADSGSTHSFIDSGVVK